MAHRDTRDFAFFKWSGVGLMLGFGFVTILSIGAPFFMIGLVLLGVMLGRGPRWPAALGALAGAGVIALVIGLIGAIQEPGVWIASGASLALLNATAFWWVRCRPAIQS